MMSQMRVTFMVDSARKLARLFVLMIARLSSKMVPCWNRILKAIANSLDPDEMPQKVASHQDPNFVMIMLVHIDDDDGGGDDNDDDDDTGN
ncbi:hypothetical protein DPMN_141725 [Dreissena polymorpha]|uniref:Uncharacterized protein n=1 Tax=Dreissena polymorpha TaxID=45954 RepID=A0A9D4GFX5_DREPO|nr:hypothetical protein DPMN_141725 [Dreissena polymorpha]